MAGWLSGTRALRGAVARPELRAERRELLETLELLVACGGMTPSTTDWCHWVPREYNDAADYLAGCALSERRSAVWLNGHWRRYKTPSLVVFSDAGLKTRREGQEVAASKQESSSQSGSCHG